jgi:DNA primase
MSIDIIGLLEKLDIQFWTEGKNCTRGWVNIQCPFCSDTTSHLGINLRSGAFHCWKCNESGGLQKIPKLRHEIARISRADLEAMSLYVKDVVDTENGKFHGKKCQFSKRMIPIFPIPKFLEGIAATRGLLTSTLARHAAGYTMELPNDFRYRLIFPNTISRNLVSYIGMDTTGLSSVKYKACRDEDAEVPVKSCLYGFDDAPENSILVLVEGIFDKIRLGNHALAMFGTGWTMNQILLLRKKSPRKVFILFDSDDAGRIAAKKLSSAIWFCPCEILELENYKDPGEMPQEEADKLMTMLTEDA